MISPMTNIDTGDASNILDQTPQATRLYQGSDMGLGWNIALRLAGLFFLGIAGAAIWWAYSLIHKNTGQPATLLDYLLALIGFTGASSGCALFLLGTHLFDEVEISTRW